MGKKRRKRKKQPRKVSTMGLTLKSYLRKRGIKQKDLAEKLGYHPQTLSNLASETAKHRQPVSVGLLVGLAQELHIDVEKLAAMCLDLNCPQLPMVIQGLSRASEERQAVDALPPVVEPPVTETSLTVNELVARVNQLKETDDG